ncbi:TPA: ferredoxin family protein, partial [Shigella flexneri]|nr:ferredoxin family protein [Shigella flexneri]
MSVARNLWRVADAPHIVPADSVERQMVQRLINACPVGLFSLTQEGDLRIDYRGCLE